MLVRSAAQVTALAACPAAPADLFDYATVEDINRFGTCRKAIRNRQQTSAQLAA